MIGSLQICKYFLMEMNYSVGENLVMLSFVVTFCLTGLLYLSAVTLDWLSLSLTVEPLGVIVVDFFHRQVTLTVTQLHQGTEDTVVDVLLYCFSARHH